jgi:hypothetical protein
MCNLPGTPPPQNPRRTRNRIPMARRLRFAIPINRSRRLAVVVAPDRIASSRCPITLATAVSNSAWPFASAVITVKPRAAATDPRAAPSIVDLGSAGSPRRPTRWAAMIPRSSSTHLGAREATTLTTPATFPQTAGNLRQSCKSSRAIIGPCTTDAAGRSTVHSIDSRSGPHLRAAVLITPRHAPVRQAFPAAGIRSRAP